MLFVINVNEKLSIDYFYKFLYKVINESKKVQTAAVAAAAAVAMHRSIIYVSTTHLATVYQ